MHSHASKFIFCLSKSITCYICLCNVWHLFTTLLNLCYLIHDYTQSQSVILRVCVFFWGGAGSLVALFLCLFLVNMTFCLPSSWVMFTKENLASMLYASGHVRVSSLCTLLFLEIKMLPFVFSYLGTK